MKFKSVVVHVGWGLAAVAAFVAGSMRSEKSTGEEAGAVDRATRSTVSSRSGDLVGGDNRRARGGREERDASASGPGVADIFGSCAGLGLDALADRAFKDPNPINRRLAFSKLLESMTAENAGEMREMMTAMGMGGSELRDFHYSWGALAGQEAFDFAAASEERDMEATMSGWAASDPNKAIAMLENLPESMAGQKAALAESVISGLADYDLALATDTAVRLAAEGVGNPSRLIRAVANETLRSGNPAEAAAWAESLDNGDIKGAAMDRVAGAYVRSNPQEAARWIGQFAGEEYAARAVAEVGEEWGEREPVQALGWLETLPAGNGQKDGFSSVLGDWEDSDPVAASEYLAKMPPSPQRDAAVSGFARGYAWQDPQTAIAWAQDISDPALRQESLTRAGQAYYRRDPESARTWLESSGLPAETRQAILNPRR